MNAKIPPPLIGLACAALMWWLDRALPGASVVPASLRGIGNAAIVIGVSIDVVALVSFLRARTTVNPLTPDAASTLVVKGPFRFSRNPMYLGLLCVLSGWAWRLGSASPLLCLPGFIAAVQTWQIVPEEQALRKKFGPAYDAYCQRVRRWI
jgi:protein-S-isoprenylcysteine O-methyltransferase Ste14